jgi:UDP-glucose 4-epimerase
MSAKTILITGGAGYIGSHANLALAERGHATVVLDNLVYGHREFVQWGEFVEADILDAQALDKVFASHDIDAVMHFAAFAYVGESMSDPAKYYHNNVVGTLNLMDAMRRHGVDKMIFSSTCATYGVPLEMPLTESHPQAPINPYGWTKLMIERAMLDYGQAYGLRSVALRYFNAAGADPEGRVGERHDPETHLIPLTLFAALDQGREIRIFGTDYDTPDGTCIRDYIHVTDLAQAHVLAYEYLAHGGETQAFNLGNGQGFSVREVIDCARRVSGREIRAVEDERRPGDPPRLIGSSEKIIATLGWAPKYDGLERILQTAWDWHCKDR